MFHMWEMPIGMGWWMAFGGLWMVIFWGGLIALIVWGIMKLSRQGDTNPIRVPLVLATDRYAIGEIS